MKMVKSIGPVATCVMLLVVGATAPASAQTTEDSNVPDAIGSEIMAGPEQAESDAVQRLRAGVGSHLMPLAAIRGVELSRAEDAAAVPALVQQSRRSGLTWLIVGGSIIGAGLLVGGDAGTALSVAGALGAGYGVYLLVRSPPDEGPGAVRRLSASGGG